jgi:hypothetical protein
MPKKGKQMTIAEKHGQFLPAIVTPTKVVSCRGRWKKSEQAGLEGPASGLPQPGMAKIHKKG